MTQRKTNMLLVGLATLGVLMVIAVAGVAQSKPPDDRGATR